MSLLFNILSRFDIALKVIFLDKSGLFGGPNQINPVSFGLFQGVKWGNQLSWF